MLYFLYSCMDSKTNTVYNTVMNLFYENNPASITADHVITKTNHSCSMNTCVDNVL